MSNSEGPELVHRRANHKSTIRSGRTIGEAREKLETANERAAARKKDKQKKALRVSFTTIGFAILTIVLFVLGFFFVSSNRADPINITVEEPDEFQPTIEVIDEDAAATSGKITTRMNNYIGQVEKDFRDLGYTPVKAVIPLGSVRSINFYLDGYNGFIKMTIDRGSAVSVEDADRLIRYLAGQGITDFEYLDVRIDNKAYWR